MTRRQDRRVQRIAGATKQLQRARRQVDDVERLPVLRRLSAPLAKATRPSEHRFACLFPAPRAVEARKRGLVRIRAVTGPGDRHKMPLSSSLFRGDVAECRCGSAPYLTPPQRLIAVVSRVNSGGGGGGVRVGCWSVLMRHRPGRPSRCPVPRPSLKRRDGVSGTPPHTGGTSHPVRVPGRGTNPLGC